MIIITQCTFWRTKKDLLLQLLVAAKASLHNMNYENFRFFLSVNIFLQLFYVNWNNRIETDTVGHKLCKLALNVNYKLELYEKI